MVQTDIVLVSGLDWKQGVAALPQYGQYILHKILEQHYKSELVCFDRMQYLGEFSYDGDYDDVLDRMADYLLSLNSKTIGFYTICNNFLTVVGISKRIARKAPDIAIIFGGPHATMTYEHCLKTFPYLRAVCMGESERSILPLVSALVNNSTLENVPGIAYIQDGQLHQNPACELIPAEELTDYAVYDYTVENLLSLPMEGGRGCPFHCSFCSTNMFWHRRFRVKPVEHLIAEMDRFNRETGATRFSINHDIFTANRKHLTAFCETLIAKGSPYTWDCSSRIDVLDEDIVRLMRRSGCREIFLGIESGSPRMQKIIGKNLNLKNANSIILLMKQLGFQITASFIYGLPDEIEEDFDQTLEMLEAFFFAGIFNCQLHRFFPLPATPDAIKIRDKIYFDEYDIDMSIAERKAMTPENIELILQHPDLFLQYYSFRNEVRQKFRWADSLMLINSNLSIHFKQTCTMLLKRLGYKRLYQKYEDIFKEMSIKFIILSFEERSRLILKLLSDIVEKEQIPELTELFRYENDVFTFINQEDKSSRQVTYKMDIVTAIRDGIYNMRPFRGLLKWDEKSKNAKLIPIPEWIHFENGE